MPEPLLVVPKSTYFLIMSILEIHSRGSSKQFLLTVYSFLERF